MSIYGLMFVLCFTLMFGALGAVCLPKSRVAAAWVGWGGAGAVMLSGVVLSLILHTQHVQSGQPAGESPLIPGLLAVLCLCLPALLAATARWFVSGGRRLWQCVRCGYDLRGNAEAMHCSECGRPVRRSLRARPQSNLDLTRSNSVQ